MYVNQCFSFSRMAMMKKRDLLENWRKNLYTFLGIFLVFLGMYILIMNRYDYTNSNPHMSVDRYINSYVSVFCVITSFFLLYFSSAYPLMWFSFLLLFSILFLIFVWQSLLQRVHKQNFQSVYTQPETRYCRT